MTKNCHLDTADTNRHRIRNTKNEDSVLGTDATQSFRFRNWCFTLNNYTEEELDTLDTQKTYRMRIGKEVGESGTPHLQGYLEAKNPIKFDTLRRMLPRAHWEPAYKSRGANLNYTGKEGDLIRDDFPRIYVYKGEDLPTTLYPWQIDIMSKISSVKQSNRKIIWIHEKIGCTGKSMFGKYLEFHNKNICYSRISKSNDILTAANLTYNTYYFDFPRCLGPDFCPFTALECILDGSVDDCKLKKEPRRLRFSRPWVIVVSNFYPKLDKISIDRWELYNITSELSLQSITPEEVVKEDWRSWFE